MYSKRDLKHKRLSSKIAGYIDYYFLSLIEGADGVKYAMPLPSLWATGCLLFLTQIILWYEYHNFS